MKKKCLKRGIHIGCFKRVLLIMKLTVLLFFIGFMSVSASIYSQSTKLTLHLESVTFLDVFNIIEENSEFVFIYKNDVVDLDKKINIEVEDLTVDVILDEIFSGNDINYEILDKQIILTRNRLLSSREATIESPIDAIKENEKQLEGTVVDAKGIAIPGAAVMVKGETIGTITDAEGVFHLAVPEEATTLLISFVGMKAVEIPIGNKLVFKVVLEEEAYGLEEVVAVGYGIQKKESVVGAITQIETDALVKSGVSNVTNAIAGKLSGVLTIQQTGEPGSDDSEIIIRGLSSWNGSQPLILVDGVERDFRDLDPNEVKTVSVLKDASATAVFGAKGANGVIIVTTQRGREGKPKMNFSATAGVEKAARIPDHIDSYTTMSMLNVAYMNQQYFEELVSDYALSQYQNPSTRLASLQYPDVNWFDMTTKTFAPTTNENFNVSGGTDFVKYFCSLGHLYQSDFFKNTNQGDLDSRYWYHRINYRANIDFNLTKSTQLSFNLGGDVGIKNRPASSPWRNLYSASPSTFPAYFPSWVLEEVPDPDYPDATGSRLSQAFNSYVSNPYANMASGSFNRYLSSKLFTDIILDQKLDFITKGLSVKAKASMSTYYQNNSLKASYSEPQYMLYYDRIGVDENGDGIVDQNPWYRAGEGDEVYVIPPVNISIGGLVTSGNDIYYKDVYYEAGINYSRGFNNHNVSGLLLVNRQQKNKGTDFPYYNQGLVARTTYNYKLKYLVEFNIGYTGSERFAPGNRYGFFPSGAVGWVVSEEKFFKEALPWVSKLKLRYSDGKVGSDHAANRWLYISDYYNYQGYINEDKAANSNAQWEEARKRDIGVELGLFDGKLKASVDLFDEQREKMLLTPRSVTFIVGNSFKELNLGKLKKHGIELELEYNGNISKDLKYYVKGIFGFNENRVIFKDDLPYAPDYMRNAGKPLDAQLDGADLTGSGYFTTIDDIHNNAAPLAVQNLILGDYKYLDYNADGIIDKQDKHSIEGSLYPPITYSLTAGVTWKNFDFRVMFQGNEGKFVSYDMTFEHEFTKGDYRVHSSQLDYWTPNNPTANHESLHYATLSIDNIGWGGGSGDQGYTLGIPGRTWRDASYLRFKEIYAGYRFNSRFLEDQIGLSNLQVYASGYNLFTWTPLIEGDPERKDFTSGFYPQMRRITIGLSFSF